MVRVSAQELQWLIRDTAAEMITAAKSSHIGGVYSCADILAVLYGEILRRNPEEILDVFILSKGHCCAGVYAALRLTGYLTQEDIESYAKNGSSLMAHISHKVPNVEFSTGSLGHGLSFGVGKAIASRLMSSDRRVYVLMSDGELGEGSNWEAIQFAGFHRLSNLTAIVDYNKLQSLSTTYDTLDLEPIVDKFTAFGWSSLRLNGHSVSDLIEALQAPQEDSPRVLICDTIKGYPVSFMQNRIEWHYKPPSIEQLSTIKMELRAFFS
jgi:transketolase